MASRASRITIIAWINIDMDDLLSQSFGYELSSEADDFIRLTMKMKNGRTKILENQGFRTCRFYFIKIYMEFDYYLSINVVF